VLKVDDGEAQAAGRGGVGGQDEVLVVQVRVGEDEVALEADGARGRLLAVARDDLPWGGEGVSLTT